MTLRPIFYDTETTGIKADKDRIIELAAYDPVRDRTFSELINPTCPIPPEASRVHKITDDMVADKPVFKTIAQKFLEFCEGDVCLIAHNNDGFDIHFLREEFKRAEVPLPEFRYFDTLKWARKYRSDLPRHSLQFLREVYGFEANNAHRALDDVVILHKVYKAMTDDLSIEVALKLLAEQKTVLRMPFGKHQGLPLDQVPKSYVAWLAKSGAFEKAENEELRLSFEKLNYLPKKEDAA